jgi:large subunit ribosomal protein L9
MMDVILEEDVPKLGVVGDLVTVKDGYARNYLIPQGKAVFASKRSIEQLEHQKRLAAHKRKIKTAEAELARRKIEGLSICMTARVAAAAVDDDGKLVTDHLQKLYGSITNRDIAKVLDASGIKIEARSIQLSEPVRTVGKFLAVIRLDGGVLASLPFWVISEEAKDAEAEKKRVEAAQAAAAKAAKAMMEAAPAPTPMPVRPAETTESEAFRDDDAADS